MVSEAKGFSIRSSFPKWTPLISTLLLAGITYGVQRTALSLYADSLAQEDILTNFLIFLQVASTIVSYGLFKGISGFFSARVSNKFKRKNTMRIGLGLLVIGSITIAFGNYLWVLILGNMFIGGGLGFFFTSSMTALTDIAGAEGSAFSVGTMEFSVYLGSSIGAFFAGLIAENQGQNFTASFIFALIVAGVAVVLGFLLLRQVETTELVKGTKEEILLDSTKVETRWSVKNILKTPTLLLSYLAGHFSRIMDSLIVLLLPILLTTAAYDNFSVTQIALVTSGFTLAWALSMPITGRLSDRFGRKGAIIVGLIIEGISLVVITIVSSFPLVLILAILAGIGTAIYYPSLPSITRDVVPIVKREQSLGIYRASLDSGYFTGPLIAIGLLFAASEINLWGTSSSLDTANMLKFPFLIIGIILGLLAISFIFLAIETRPGWIQASISLKHGNKVREVFYTLEKAFNAYLKGDKKENCARLMKEAKEKEKDADLLVSKVTQALYGNVRPAPDDYHFFKITDILDSTIGHVLRSLRKLILIPQEKLSDNFIKYMKVECKLLTQLIDKSIEALEVVCIQPLASHPIFKEVHNLESKLDSNSHIGLSNAIADSAKMNATESLFMVQIIESLEIAANLIEDAVDIMKIIGMKYQVSPLVV